MKSVKKIMPSDFIKNKRKINKITAIDALEIYNTNENSSKQKELIIKFNKIYNQPYNDVIKEIMFWKNYIFRDGICRSKEDVYNDYFACVSQLIKEPVQFYNEIGRSRWVFEGYIYDVNGVYSDEEGKLLILESFDKERVYFEKLKAKFNNTANSNTTYERPRIPENIRIEVWRRDSGKCAKCGSREKLEYDHILPISRGGSNTVRNIELLCEKCNRSKGANIG